MVAKIEVTAKPKKKAVKKKTVARMKENGRPDLLTPELQTRMVELLRLGTYAEDAASDVDISHATYYNWMDRGRKERERLKMVPDAKPHAGETKFLRFLEAIEGARGKGTVMLHSQVLKSATAGDWRAAAYILERTRPKQYGNQERVEHSGSVESRVTVEMGDLEDKISQILEARKPKGGK